ncbi:MAG TPA: hypothetical protein PLP05_04870 [Sedimentisphaerales bacterium]|nr:hypothetical protein [Sedimentisphaerales bacterium]
MFWVGCRELRGGKAIENEFVVNSGIFIKVRVELVGNSCLYIWLCDGGLAVECDYVIDVSGKLGRMVCEANATILRILKWR